MRRARAGTWRLIGFLGRVGEGVKVRGMFVHPGQLTRALAGEPAMARYQAVVGTRDHQDTLTVRVELREGAALDRTALETALRTAVKLRVDVEVVAPGTLLADAQALVDERMLE